MNATKNGHRNVGGTNGGSLIHAAYDNLPVTATVMSWRKGVSKVETDVLLHLR